jgi:tetratricopeptide (TPR) repeat protein
MNKLCSKQQVTDEAPGVSSRKHSGGDGVLSKNLIFHSEEDAMASIKTIIAENVQDCLDQSDWRAAIIEMEKLFAIDQDPHVRVKIGDARRKLNRIRAAIRDYIRAADLFAEKGFVVKALAQYNLVLRLDSSNTYARTKMDMLEMLRPGRTITMLRCAPGEYRAPQQLGCRFEAQGRCS